MLIHHYPELSCLLKPESTMPQRMQKKKEKSERLENDLEILSLALRHHFTHPTASLKRHKYS